jgi:hypothetical protein
VSEFGDGVIDSEGFDLGTYYFSSIFR